MNQRPENGRRPSGRCRRGAQFLNHHPTDFLIPAKDVDRWGKAKDPSPEFLNPVSAPPVALFDEVEKVLDTSLDDLLGPTSEALTDF